MRRKEEINASAFSASMLQQQPLYWIRRKDLFFLFFLRSSDFLSFPVLHDSTTVFLPLHVREGGREREREREAKMTDSLDEEEEEEEEGCETSSLTLRLFLSVHLAGDEIHFPLSLILSLSLSLSFSLTHSVPCLHVSIRRSGGAIASEYI